jgi:hypothetical protein
MNLFGELEDIYVFHEIYRLIYRAKIEIRFILMLKFLSIDVTVGVNIFLIKHAIKMNILMVLFGEILLMFM